MKVDPRAGKPAEESRLVNIPRLMTAYYAAPLAAAVTVLIWVLTACSWCSICGRLSSFAAAADLAASSKIFELP